jgi:hypothetical protein
MALLQRESAAALFVNRSTQQWVVRDREGNFWIIPVADPSWTEREPFFPTEQTELEPIPGHYKYMLDLPF